MRNWLIFTAIYFLITSILSTTFNNQIFITDRKSTFILLIGIYLVILLIFGVYKFISKYLKNLD